MEFSNILSIALIGLMGAMSPGPDFAIVVKNCLRGTFRDGFWTAVGITTALLIHLTYCLLGVAWVISESPFLFHLIKYAGAAYLFYLGISLLREKVTEQTMAEVAKTAPSKKQSSFVSGFLCNLLNPKATLFILSLFTQFIHPEMGFWSKALLGSILAVVCFLWFVLFSYLLTHRLLQRHFARFQKTIMKIMGCVLCLLALYVVLIA